MLRMAGHHFNGSRWWVCATLASERLAHEIAGRWVHQNIAGYRRYAKLVEKYNVTTPGGDEGGGGEYATQIGFGWTNGVLVALAALYPDLKSEAERAVPE